jgi:hypothetical protein
MFFQLRTAIAYRHFARATRALDDTPPLASDRASSCEVHTMLGERDVTMYLLAVKTLLSLVGRLSVVVHSDGSLDAAAVARLRRHVTHIKVVDHATADDRAARALEPFPLLAKWRTHDAAYRRLVDVELWRETPRVIILDSDVLTNSYPAEVAAWAENGSRAFLLGQPARQSSDSGESTHVQAQFLAKVPEISAALGRTPSFIQGGTAGFCGYLNEITLEVTERALNAALAAGLPMQQWGGDQCLVIYLLSTGSATRLPADRYLNFDPTVRAAAEKACIIHFYGTHRFHARVYPRLAAQAVRRLAAGTPARAV